MEKTELEKQLALYDEVVIDALEKWASQKPDDVFFYYGEDDLSFTFKEFDEAANSIANSLMAMGVEKGDRISLFLLNPLVTSLAMFGIWKAGAVFSPINFNYQGRLLSYQINDTEPKLVITESGREPLLNHIADDIGAMKVVVHQPLESDHDYKAEAKDNTLHQNFEAMLFSDLLKGSKAKPSVVLDPWDTANIVYTSGTTGPAKGVVHTHRWTRQYVHNALNIINQDDVIFNDLPMYHVAGCFINLARAAWVGCKVAMWDGFSVGDFWQRINKSGATMAILLDVMMPWLQMPPASDNDRRNTLNKAYMQPLPLYHQEFARRFGIDFVICGYGQTEAGNPFIGILDEFGDEEGTPPDLYKGYSKQELRQRVTDAGGVVVEQAKAVALAKGFMGSTSPLLDVAVLDEWDNELEANQHGQLGVRSKLPYLLFSEYFNKPDATAETFRNQWLHTGDGVYKDEDGFFYFVDRIGGFIRTRGENVSSYQVEDIVNSYAAVAASAALPIPAAEGGEDDIVVFVVAKEGQTIIETDFREWLKGEMPKYMLPKHLRFIEALPLTPTFKVEKYKLKQMILEELQA